MNSYLRTFFLAPYESETFLIKRKALYMLVFNILMLFAVFINFTLHLFVLPYSYILTLGNVLFFFLGIESLYLLKKGNLEQSINLYLIIILSQILIHKILIDFLSGTNIVHYSALITTLIICVQYLIISLLCVKKYQSIFVIMGNNVLILLHIATLYSKYTTELLSTSIKIHFLFYFLIVLICSIFYYMLLKTNSDAIRVLGIKNELLSLNQIELEHEINERTKDLFQTIEKLIKTQTHLSESKCLLRTIIDTAPIFIAYIDENHIVRIANNEYNQIFKTTKETIENQHIGDLLPKELYRKQKTLLNQSILGKTITFHEEVHTLKEDISYIYGIYTPFYSNEGHHNGIIAIILDITEQKMIEHQLKALNDQLLKLSTTDPLTGVYNRRKMMEVASLKFSQSQMDNTPLSICMLDIDHFKKVNDTYGHAIGDAVLRTVAQRCQNTLRNSDFFGRFGGEEFFIILPNVEKSDALIIAEKIRLSIANHPFKTNEQQIVVTLSIGVASLSSETNIDDFITHADTALYEAKNNGRNLVKLY